MLGVGNTLLTNVPLMDEGRLGMRPIKDSAHQANLPDTLACCELAGHRPETVVIGMQPQDYASLGVELTPVCAKALPDFCRAVAEELRAWGCAVLERVDFEN